jgi:Ni,Fe-hydrogenase maturation factor
VKLKFVKNVIKDWKEMDGDTLLEKKINAYITASWVWSKDVPSDECIKITRDILKMKKVSIKKIEKLIEKRFFENPANKTLATVVFYLILFES